MLAATTGSDRLTQNHHWHGYRGHGGTWLQDEPVTVSMATMGICHKLMIPLLPDRYGRYNLFIIIVCTRNILTFHVLLQFWCQR